MSDGKNVRLEAVVLPCERSATHFADGAEVVLFVEPLVGSVGCGHFEWGHVVCQNDAGIMNVKLDDSGKFKTVKRCAMTIMRADEARTMAKSLQDVHCWVERCGKVGHDELSPRLLMGSKLTELYEQKIAELANMFERCFAYFAGMNEARLRGPVGRAAL